jgi:hypothetical protein
LARKSVRHVPDLRDRQLDPLRVAALTYPELFRTRETVMAETPARSATSLIRLIFGVTRFASVLGL